MRGEVAEGDVAAVAEAEDAQVVPLEVRIE